MSSSLISTGNIIIRPTATSISTGTWIMEEKLRWLDEKYLSDFDQIQVDSQIRYQEPFTEMKEIVQEYSIASDEMRRIIPTFRTIR